MSFAEDLEAEAAPEQIESVVIGNFGGRDYADEDDLAYGEDRTPLPVPLDKRGVVLPWADARPLLDFEYDTGFGLPDCYAVYAYTQTRIIFVSQYDGATAIESAPRNPTPCVPVMPGG